MFDFIDQILSTYDEAEKKKQLNLALQRLGIGSPTVGEEGGVNEFGDQGSLNQLYYNLVWVYRCVNFIATNLAQLPLQFFSGDMDVTESPEFDIFRNPNLLQTPYDFLVESYTRLELQGEMFWELDRRIITDSKIIGMYADWRSEEVKIIPDKKYMIKEYRRTINEKVHVFPPENVFYIKYINPYDPLRGLSPLSPTRHSATMELNAISFNKNFFKQGARPSGVFSTDQHLTKPESDRLQAVLKNKYADVTKMHEILVLWGGLKFNALNSMSMADMQFKDLRLMNREEIIAAYGLSLEVLGLGQKTYQNVQFFRRMAWTETLIPKMKKITDLINKKFVPILTDRDVEMKPDFSQVEALKEERSKKVVDFDKGFKVGAVTPNEIRTNVFGFEEIDTPEMNSTYIPVNLMPTTTCDSNIGEEPKAVPMQILSQKGLTYADRTKLWHMKINQFDANERMFKAEMDNIFDAMSKDIRKRVPTLFKEAGHRADDGSNVTVPPSAVARGTHLFDQKYWKGRLQEEGEPLILRILGDAAQLILNEVNDTFDPIHPFVRQELGRRVTLFSEFVSSTTEKDIKKLLVKALQETADLSIANQTRAIQAVFGEYFVLAKKNRAQMIARTETYGASNLGTKAGMIQGKFEKKMWLTSRDDKVRESHLIDGQVVTVNELFTLGDGSQVDYPQAINERCVIIPTQEPISA